jgi:hypothetical protein
MKDIISNICASMFQIKFSWKHGSEQERAVENFENKQWRYKSANTIYIPASSSIFIHFTQDSTLHSPQVQFHYSLRSNHVIGSRRLGNISRFNASVVEAHPELASVYRTFKSTPPQHRTSLSRNPRTPTKSMSCNSS